MLGQCCLGSSQGQGPVSSFRQYITICCFFTELLDLTWRTSFIPIPCQRVVFSDGKALFQVVNLSFPLLAWGSVPRACILDVLRPLLLHPNSSLRSLCDLKQQDRGEPKTWSQGNFNQRDLTVSGKLDTNYFWARGWMQSRKGIISLLPFCSFFQHSLTRCRFFCI